MCASSWLVLTRDNEYGNRLLTRALNLVHDHHDPPWWPHVLQLKPKKLGPLPAAFPNLEAIGRSEMVERSEEVDRW